MNQKDFKIDFIGIGVSRAATTWIWECLREHPQLCLPPFKRGTFFIDPKYQADRRYFAKCKPGQKKGEINADYYASSEIAQRMRKIFPNVKLIISLRNPIEAIYSLYYYNKHFGREKAPTFEEALRLSAQYLERGFYYKKLVSYLQLFPREQFLYLIYEDIEKNPAAFIQSIFRFLEVNPSFAPFVLKKRVNPIPSSTAFPKLYGKITTFLRRYRLTDRVFVAIKTLNLRQVKENIFKKLNKFEKPLMDPKTRKYLQHVYQTDIRKIEKLIGKDLSFWK